MGINQVTDRLLTLPRGSKRAVVISLDVAVCLLAVWIAFYLRLGEWTSLSGMPWPAAAVSVLLAIPLFTAAGLYRAIFRRAGASAFLAITRICAVYGLIYAAIFTSVGIPPIPRTVGLIQPLLLLFGILCTRGLAHFWLGGEYKRLLRKQTRRNVLIYGAGLAGQQLAGALENSHEVQVSGFLDDNPDLQGMTLNGKTIYAPSRMAAAINRHRITDIYLAIPSANRKRRNEVLDELRSFAVNVRTLPGIMDLAHGRVTINDLRELDIEDLLGRDAVRPDKELVNRILHRRTVLVTGAGGSIGSELCRQILSENPSTLLLLDISEYALYAAHRELRDFLSTSCSDDVILIPLIASVENRGRLSQILSAWRPDIIYHAAAYKHVPLVEHNPCEGVRNNVFGTITLAKLAVEYGVRKFVLVSTDKAVRPTNIMGASKRCAEMALQAYAEKKSGTCFLMVRFGNVLGSSGSVVPLFRSQIAAGGPLTITDPEVTRYFMTIREAAQLVIQASAMASGGEVFVLDMGEPVKIADLARTMIELSGLTVQDENDPDGDVSIHMIGLRPGEKLYEELLIGNNPAPTDHPRIMKAEETFMPQDEIEPELMHLRDAINRGDVASLKATLKRIVPEFTSDRNIVDWVHIEQRKAEDALPKLVKKQA